MQFNSFVFILIFLPITLITYFAFNKINDWLGKIVLIVASVVFYSYLDFKVFFILGVSMIIRLCKDYIREVT